ncbi:glycosyltransferase [Corynebacterium sp. TAE3-ERU12]|uniref:glycosyltransferase n=1 Tax=Corynebacterium sp. TAE3-ERU12 TaxID=2849491 RepID=UPI001C468568|nr:glycosyltransferase [Corynebacterium sp. TAE3-ERU12]MBV7295634.1 glycosyltransferase [Corynebacterium sp. TAE3-ERU12]
MKRVAVFRAELLPGSETFIRDQTDAMTSWQPILIGTTRVDSPLLRGDEQVLYGRSLRDRVALWLAELTGVAPRITRALRDSGAQLVHAHFLKDAWLVTRACRRAGLPLIVTCHGYDVTSLARSRWYRLRSRIVFAQAARVIAVSRFIADRAWALGARDVLVSYTGVQPRPGVAGAGADIVFVGRLVAKKGVADLIEAMRRVGNVSARIVGDGPLRAELKRRAAGLDVEFLGALPPHQVANELASAKIFVGPSQTAADGNAEGFGQVFVEAAVAGLPVVAYRHGGVVEAVAEGGILVEPGDITALATAIRRLLDDPQLRQEMGSAGRRRALTHFHMDHCTRRVERIYDDVIRTQSTSRTSEAPPPPSPGT